MKKVLFWTTVVVSFVMTTPFELVCLLLECIRFLRWKMITAMAKWTDDEGVIKMTDSAMTMVSDTYKVRSSHVYDFMS